MAFRKIEAGLVHAPVDEFIGKTGTIFYDNDLGDFRISDGVTPGGIALSFGGGGGGTYTLPTATTTVKGGVKIDGTTIAITNQVIRVGTVPYSSLSGTPTIPTNNNQLTNGAAYITSAALSGLATETYVTTRGYLTTVAYADVTGKPTLFSGSYADLTNKPTIPTNNNELTNGASYITSSALTGLATETYVTTRGYLTTVAYADITGKPTLFSGSYTDLTNKPTIPTDINQLTDASGLLGGGGGGGGTTYITNTVENPYSFSIAGDDSTLREIANGESIKITGAGGITITTDAEGNLTVTGTPVSLAGYATETYVTTRGYITGLSYNDLTDKPNLAGTYTFNVAADDSTMREISSEETVKFVGAGGITTASDAEGKITITQGTTSSLVNGAYTVSLGSDGVLTIPPNGLIIASTGQYGQQHEMRLGDGLSIGQGGALANYRNETWTLYGQNSDAGTQIRLPGQVDSDNGLSLLIQHNFANSSIDIESLGNIWSFRSDGLLTFPDGTTQSTAPAITIAADDSTQRTIYLGEESIKFVGAGGVTTASDADGNITITGPSLAGLATETYVTTRGYITSSALIGLATETFVTSQGYITGLSWNQLTDKPNLAGTYSWSIAADDSTQLEISAGNLVKIVGTNGITTTSTADGLITISGVTQDRLTSNARSAVLNSNGTFSLPTLTSAPSTPQAGQMALADGVSWDPIAQNNGVPYMIIYTGTAWVGMGGVTMDQVYMAVLELGSAG